MVTKVKGNGTSTFNGNVDVTGNVDANGQLLSNTPAFSVQLGSTQSISETIATKMQFDSELFDTDNAFNTSTYEFTVPTGKAGIYAINALVRIDSQVSTNLAIAIFYLYKNGAVYKRAYDYFSGNYTRTDSITISTLVDCAEGDYLSLYAYINSIDNTGGNLNNLTYSDFSGHRLIT